jgi:hypothetical protein
MTNVVSLDCHKARRDDSALSGRDRAALAAGLVDLIERVRAATDRAAVLSGPPLQIEQTAQYLLDALSALEAAADALTDDGEWVPF